MTLRNPWYVWPERCCWSLAITNAQHPQNWSWGKKHAALVVLALGSFFVKFTATILVSSMVSIELDGPRLPVHATD